MPGQRHSHLWVQKYVSTSFPRRAQNHSQGCWMESQHGMASEVVIGKKTEICWHLPRDPTNACAPVCVRECVHMYAWMCLRVHDQSQSMIKAKIDGWNLDMEWLIQWSGNCSWLYLPRCPTHACTPVCVWGCVCTCMHACEREQVCMSCRFSVIFSKKLIAVLIFPWCGTRKSKKFSLNIKSYFLNKLSA